MRINHLLPSRFHWQSRFRSIVIIVATVLAGVSLVLLTRAATQSVAFEAEAGVPQLGAQVQSVAGASGSSAIRFGMPMNTGGKGRILLPNTLEISKYGMNARADVANPPQLSGVNLKLGSYTLTGGNGTEGQFRVYCKYSHFNYDDPIVYPGQPNAAHLHMYWGNTRADANSTKQSLTTTGGGTCDGFELNRTAYWMPALLDGSGKVVVPKAIVMYYKTKQTSVASRMPQGLKMIAGNKDGNTTVTGFHNMVEWNCYDGSASWLYPTDVYGQTSGTTIPASCPSGYDLNSLVYFQQCWDGVGLERTNVAFANDQGQCPSGWKTMPQVSYHIFWPKSPTGSYANWYLSSDRMSVPYKKNGSTLHADWFGGWNDSIMDEWIANCIKPARNCGGGRLGDGYRALMDFYPTDYEGPTNFLPVP